jgi:hypothetical protein
MHFDPSKEKYYYLMKGIKTKGSKHNLLANIIIDIDFKINYSLLHHFVKQLLRHSILDNYIEYSKLYLNSSNNFI